jgi:pSer/pThr/pTyr-binding forkhead associated (FHA) protein
MKGLLQILTGEGRAGIIDLETGTYSIGRDENAEIKINSREVSRKHAKLIVEPQSVRVVDCGSANGTNVNGSQVTSGTIQDGDRIQIGDVIFQFQSKQPRTPISIGPQEREALTTRKPKEHRTRETLVAPIARVVGAKVLPLKKFIVAICALGFSSIVLISGLAYRGMLRDRLQDEALIKAQNLVRYLSEKNREDLRNGNELLLDVETVAKEKGVREALIINGKGRVVAPITKLAQIENDPFTMEALSQTTDRTILPGPAMNDGNQVIVHPIRAYNDKTGMYQTLGVAKIVFNKDEAVGYLPEATRMIALMVLLSIAFAFGASLFLVRLLTEPLQILAENLHQWRTGQEIERVAAPFQEWDALFKAVDQVMEEKGR